MWLDLCLLAWFICSLIITIVTIFCVLILTFYVQMFYHLWNYPNTWWHYVLIKQYHHISKESSHLDWSVLFFMLKHCKKFLLALQTIILHTFTLLKTKIDKTLPEIMVFDLNRNLHLLMTASVIQLSPLLKYFNSNKDFVKSYCPKM